MGIRAVSYGSLDGRQRAALVLKDIEATYCLRATKDVGGDIRLRNCGFSNRPWGEGQTFPTKSKPLKVVPGNGLIARWAREEQPEAQTSYARLVSRHNKLRALNGYKDPLPRQRDSLPTILRADAYKLPRNQAGKDRARELAMAADCAFAYLSFHQETWTLGRLVGDPMDVEEVRDELAALPGRILATPKVDDADPWRWFEYVDGSSTGWTAGEVRRIVHMATATPPTLLFLKAGCDDFDPITSIKDVEGWWHRCKACGVWRVVRSEELHTAVDVGGCDFACSDLSAASSCALPFSKVEARFAKGKRCG